MTAPTAGGRRGSAAIEFALCLPFVLALFGGVLELGNALYWKIAVTNAVRDGARMGVTEEDPASAAVDRALAVLSEFEISCDTALDCEMDAQVQSIDGVDYLVMTASVPYVPVVGLLDLPLTIDASFTMRLQE